MAHGESIGHVIDDVVKGQGRSPVIFGWRYLEERERLHWTDSLFFKHYLV